MYPPNLHIEKDNESHPMSDEVQLFFLLSNPMKYNAIYTTSSLFTSHYYNKSQVDYSAGNALQGVFFSACISCSILMNNNWYALILIYTVVNLLWPLAFITNYVLNTYLQFECRHKLSLMNELSNEGRHPKCTVVFPDIFLRKISIHKNSTEDQDNVLI